MLALQRAAGNRATVAALRRGLGGRQGVLARDKAQAKVCDSPGSARKVTLQPVFFKAGENDKSPTGASWKKRFEAAKPIWAKLGVTFSPEKPVVKVDAELKAAGSSFPELSKIAGTVDGAGIEVFFVDNDLDFAGARGAATVNPGSEDAKVVVSDRGKNQNLLAHELGHVLGIMHPKSHINPGDPDSIMEPSKSNDVANPSRNTIANYFAIQWPAAGDETCLNPDPPLRKK